MNTERQPADTGASAGLASAAGTKHADSAAVATSYQVDVPGLRRLSRWLGADTGWSQPVPAVDRSDWIASTIAMVACWLTVASLNQVVSESSQLPLRSLLWNLLSASVLFVPLLFRRRYPIIAGLSTIVHLLALYQVTAMAVTNLATMVVYFIAVFSMVSWAKDRAAVTFACLVMIGGISFWLANEFASIGSYVHAMSGDPDATVTRTKAVATVAIYVLVNGFFYGGAIMLGRQAWWQRYTEYKLNETIALSAQQSEQLQQRAVHDDRLRIARDLHDVVSHSVAAAGVHAGSVSRVLQKTNGEPTPPAVFESLDMIQEVSRTAVVEMRTIVGALRVPGDAANLPDLSHIHSLVESSSTEGLSVTIDVVDDALDVDPAVPEFVSRSLYRVVQESLANVRKHSTGRSATVTVRRMGHGQALEVEVVNDGQARATSSGSGFGLAGIRERAVALRGECEIGPRHSGGFGVRIKVPLNSFAR